MRHYAMAVEAYQRDDCELALTHLDLSESPLAPELGEEIKRKLAHLQTAQAYRDKYEWVGQQIPIHRLTWEVYRVRWIVTYVRQLATMGYSTLVDLGCQKGEMTVWFGGVPGMQRVVGVDLSPTCIAHARTNPQNTSIIDYVEADAEDLPFEDNEFSIAVMSGLLEHVRSPDRCMAEAKRVVTDGGLILGNTPLGGYEFFPEQEAISKGDTEYLRRSEWRAHVRCWNPHVNLMYEPDVRISFHDMTDDPNLPFSQHGVKTGEWCFMLRVIK